MPDSVVGRFAIPVDHPSLPGHFPQHPIVPGVVLLDHILTLILPPDQAATALPGVKFTGAVLPGETVEITASPARAGRIGFAATCGGRPVLRGSVEVAA